MCKTPTFKIATFRVIQYTDSAVMSQHISYKHIVPYNYITKVPFFPPFSLLELPLCDVVLSVFLLVTYHLAHQGDEYPLPLVVL